MTLPNELIPDSAVEAALFYLSADPAPVAVAKAELVWAEAERKKIRSKLFLASTRKTVAEREAEAECHEDYMVAWRKEADATEKHENERAKQLKANTVCELWRSIQANTRAAERIR